MPPPGPPRSQCWSGKPPPRRGGTRPTAAAASSPWWRGGPAPTWTGLWAACSRTSCRLCSSGGAGPVADTHWARWHRGPIVAALVDPAPSDWDLVAEMGIPAVLVHSQPLDSPDLAEALANGASALVAADRVGDHFLPVLRMVDQGYLVVDSMPMRPLIGVVQARWDEPGTGSGGLPELTSRESDILRSLASGHSIRQPARALGIAPKTVENVQTRLFRKLGVRNRSGALTVADAFGLLPPPPSEEHPRR